MKYTDKYKLANALLIYKGRVADEYQLTSENYYAEIHNIAFSPEGKPHLLAGRSLTNNAMKSISNMFSKRIYKNNSTGFLPENLLSIKDSTNGFSLFWYRKAQNTRMLFKTGKKTVSEKFWVDS